VGFYRKPLEDVTPAYVDIIHRDPDLYYTNDSESVNSSVTVRQQNGQLTYIPTAEFTTTGSNVFTGNQFITGSVEITGSLHVNTHPVVLGQLSWARYDDTQYTTSSFRSVTVAGGEITIPNNGGYSITTHLHSDIQFYDSGSQKVYAEKEGDVYLMTITFRAKAANANAAYARIQMDSTGLTPYRRVGKDLFFGKGNNEWHDYHEVFQFYADTDFVSNGNQWKIRAIGATVDVADVIYFIQRTQNHLI
jgi:hypothetical protein